VPLQNRVTPFGEIAALPGRGTLTGNRGILIDDERRLVRQWQTKRWIACRLQYKGIRRQVMQPHAWTELFFLDEATALAAGHRPCAECRRDDYVRFRDLWKATIGEASADAMDLVLHRQRLDGSAKRTYRGNLTSLPDGSYVAIGGTAWLVWDAWLYAWSDRGYLSRRSRPALGEADVLTPPAIVTILRGGYAPHIHPSAATHP
jgi:hypothetical protein